MKTPKNILNKINRRAVTAVSSRRGALFSLAVLLACQQAHAAALAWKNTVGVTDFNSSASYTPATTPTTSSVTDFTGAEVSQPNVTANVTIAGINFSSSATGYDLTSTGGFTVTLNGYGSSASGTASSSSPSIYTASTGTDTIDAALNFTSASTNSTVYQAGAGGNLIINGKISGASPVPISILGNSTITLNGANDFSGGITLSGVSLANGNATLAIGNNSALGTGTVTFSSGDTLAASGGARTVGNAVLFGGNGIIAGTNDLALSGTFTSSGSSSRSLTVNNTGVTTLSGSVYLAPDNTTARGLIVNGTGATTISGAIANNASGNTLASFLTYSGSNTLTVTGNNTYTGATSISGGGTFKAASGTGKALGTTSGITVNGGSTLLFGAANQSTSTIGITLGTVTPTAGTIKTTGFSQGSASASGLGALTLTTGSTGNTVDFSSTAAILSFAGFNPNSAVLTVANYLSAGPSGGPDELIFATDQSGNLADFNFGTGAGDHVAEATLAGGFYEVYYTISNVPEPTTIFGGALMVGAMGWTQRRRLRGLAGLTRANDAA